MPQLCLQPLQRCSLLQRSSLVLRSTRVTKCAAQPEGQGNGQYSNEKRRRGRPAHMRSPDDSPLRDGNRDRLMGMLTERSARTLAYYLLETNHNMHNWMNRFIKDHPIPKDGNWDDVSGDTFLRTLLSMPIEEATPWGRDELFHNTSGTDVDPRSMAQRIMEIRTQLAAEFIQDLKLVAEDNKLLQLETLAASLLSTEDAIADGSAAARQESQAADAAAGAAPASAPRPNPSRGADGGESEATRQLRAKKAKKSVLPASGTTPSNWRLRLEVEAQVYGDDPDASPAPNAATGIPDSAATGILPPTRLAALTGPSTPDAPADNAAPPTPENANASSPSPSSPSPSSASPSPSSPSLRPPPPPLHPEVAEMLPLIRASPSALTPDIASMLSSLADMGNGQLHPDIVDALRDAVAAGARLHPEIAELLGIDIPTAGSSSSGSGKAASSSGSSAVRASGVGAATASPSSSAPLGQFGKPPVAPSAAAAAAASAAAAAASAAPSAKPQVAEVPVEEPEEENSITALQNDSCLHSDED